MQSFQRITRVLDGATRTGDGEELRLGVTGGVFVASAGDETGAVGIRFDEDREVLPLKSGRVFRRPFRRLWLVHAAGLSGLVELLTFEAGQEIGDGRAAAAAASTPTLAVGSVHSFNEAGALGTRLESWYPGGNIMCASVATLPPALGDMYAMPLPIFDGGDVDRLGVWIQAGGTAGSVTRAAIYEGDRNEGCLYPGALIVETGELASTTAGLKSVAIAETLARNVVYWLAVRYGVAAPTTYATNSAGRWAFKGWQAGVNTGPIGAFRAFNQPYGAFPATWPVFDGNMLTLNDANIPCGWVRFAS